MLQRSELPHTSQFAPIVLVSLQSFKWALCIPRRPRCAVERNGGAENVHSATVAG